MVVKKGFPNIDDLRRTVPKQGLLDPSLRKNGGLSSTVVSKGLPGMTKRRGKRSKKNPLA